MKLLSYKPINLLTHLVYIKSLFNKSMFTKLLTCLLCLVMLGNPTAQSHVVSSDEDGWIWVCTGSGFRYVNINKDHKGPPPAPPESQQSNSCSCCLYDAVPDSSVFFLPSSYEVFCLIESTSYQLLYSNLRTVYSPRAPPSIFFLSF